MQAISTFCFAMRLTLPSGMKTNAESCARCTHGTHYRRFHQDLGDRRQPAYGPGPNCEIAIATASSKKLLAPVSAPNVGAEWSTFSTGSAGPCG